jgi:lipopolysaccharide biosynthesis glycosyltransferase
MKADCAVCYVSDLNFMLPSIISAVTLRQFIGAHKARVFIFLTGDDSRVGALNATLSPYDIEVCGLPIEQLRTFDQSKFNQSHVSHTTLGRFMLDRMLPDSIKRIVYIDGDTMIRQDPSELIDAIVPEGHLAAAEDMISLRYSKYTPRGRLKRDYVRGIGLDIERRGYMNAGIFATSRQTWRSLSQEAFAYFQDNTARCLYHDQSALNAVIGDRRLPLSLKWNFQTPYRYLGIEHYISPRIYHFHSYPKPWMGSCEPWTDLHDDYVRHCRTFAHLDLPISLLGEGELSEHNRLNWRKRLLMRSPIVARAALGHLGIKSYERKAWL